MMVVPVKKKKHSFCFLYSVLFYNSTVQPPWIDYVIYWQNKKETTEKKNEYKKTKERNEKNKK